MASATISDVKNRLSAYLRQVRAGETVVIMDRKKPIAVLAPFPPEASRDGRLEQLLAAGVLSREADPALTERGAPVPPIEVAEPEALLDALLEERRQGP